MFRRSKKLLVWCIVVSMVLTQMLFTNAAFAASRNAGLNRYETALKVSQSGWSTSEYVVLAYGEDFPDALCAAPLAKKFNAPILLTDKAALTVGVIEEINRLGATKVFIVGGEGAVSAAVANALTAAGKTVTRLAGASRAETSLKVAEQIGVTDTVVVANGEGFADALSVSPIAAAKGWPILLTGANAMDAAVKAYIGSKKVFVVGGVGAVSDAAVAGLTVERLSGADRYATNVAVMTKFAADLNFNKVYLATGEGFADALAGSALAAKFGAPIVLVGSSMPAATESFIDAKVPATVDVVALGGVSVVPESAVTAVGSGTQNLAIVSVTAITQDGRNVRVTFNSPVSGLSKADITVTHKNSGAVLGVEEVSLSSNGMTADVELLEDADLFYVEPLQVYVFSIIANGRTLTSEYQRPQYVSERIVEVDSEEREINDYKVPAGVVIDFEEVLGRTLRLWIDKDNQVTKFAINDATVKFDALEVKDADELTLVDEDKDYEIADDVIVYYNGEDMEGDWEEVDGADYAKVVLNKDGDIAYINAYDWTDFVVVEKVEDETVVLGYGNEVDVEDYVIVKGGKTVAAEDLKAGDILFFNEDEEYAEVYNKSVSGEIEEIFETEGFVVDGDKYTYAIGEDADYATGNVQYLDDDDIADFDEDVADDMQEEEKAVEVFVDRHGYAVYVDGDTGAASTSDFIAFVVKVNEFTDRQGAKLGLDVLNEAGEEVSYDIKVSDLADPDFFTGEGDIEQNSVLKITVDDEGEVDEIELLAAVEDIEADEDGVLFETDDKYAGSYKLAASVPVILAEDYDFEEEYDEDDNTPEVTTFGALKFDEVTDAQVFVNDDDEVIAIVVVGSDRDGDTTDYVAVADANSTKLSGEDTWKLKLWVNGELKTYYTEDDANTDNADEVDANGIYVVTVDDDTNEVVAVTTPTEGRVIDGTVDEIVVADKTITVDGDATVYKLADDAKILDLTGDDIELANLRDCKPGTEVRMYTAAAGSRFVKLIVIDVTVD